LGIAVKLRRDGRPDGRSKHATFERWLREHTPLVYYGLYAGADDVALAAERRRRRELWELARVRRDALACCIECRNPLIATQAGFQFCPYERAGQHEKLRRAVFERTTETPGSAVVTLDREAARWRRRRSATLTPSPPKDIAEPVRLTVGPRAEAKRRADLNSVRSLTIECT
jgi:hypothetical protein